MTMARYSGVVTDGQGNVVPNASIRVRAELPGAPLAALKSDRVGTTSKDNPFNAEADGTFFFHVVGGAYRIDASKDGQDYTRRYVGIGLAQESDTIVSGQQQRVVTAAGDVTVASDDADVILIKKNVGAATIVYLPPSASRGKPVRIVDRKYDAASHNIDIKPDPATASGETVMGGTNFVIDSNGAGITLTPLDDGTGWI